MAESNRKDNGSIDSSKIAETKQHDCFDLLAEKEGKTEHDVVMDEARKENKEDLRRLHSQSSSMSDDEFEGERKKNKKTLTDNNEDDQNDIVVVEVDKKKGVLEKIKEHLVGKQKKTEEGVTTSEANHEAEAEHEHLPENEKKEKKGIIENIKEKLHKDVEAGLGEKKEN